MKLPAKYENQLPAVAQDIMFTGVVVEAHLQDYVYLNEKSYIIFPRITFQTMLFNHFRTRDELQQFLERDFDHEITFVKKSKKKFVAIDIEACDPVKEAQFKDII